MKFLGSGPKPDHELTMEHLLLAINQVPAISRTYKDEITTLRDFAANGNFIRANSKEKAQHSTSPVPKKVGSELKNLI